MADHRKKVVYNDNKNAICYYRYSSSSQREESIEEQRQAAHRYADAHGMTIIKEYQDAAQSGTDIRRPDFNRMLYEAKILKPGYLILWKVDRLARDMYAQVMAKHELDAAGVKIEYVAEALPEDDGQRAFIEGIYGLMAEQFIINHKKNVMRGLTYNAEHCLYNGNPPFGYTGKPSQKYEIDSEKSAYVQKMFTDYADGKSSTEIAEWLNNAGVRTTKGKKFTVQAVMHILENEAYRGVYKWGDYRTEDGMPRLIDEMTWEKVQTRINKNRRGGRKLVPRATGETPPEFWLTGHIYCGYCGEPMHGYSGSSKSGKRHYYYVCSGQKKKKCGKKAVRFDLLEGAVETIVREFIDNPAMRILIAKDCYAYYQKQNEGSDAYMKSLEASLKDIEKKIDNMMKAIEAGIITESTKEHLESLEGQKKMIEGSIEAEKGRQKLSVTEADILKFLDSFTSRNVDSPVSIRKLFGVLVDKVYVYDDKAVLTMYYEEKPREISFEDFENNNKAVLMTDVDGLSLPPMDNQTLENLTGDSDPSFKRGVNPSPLSNRVFDNCKVQSTE